jgi:glucokinase
MKSPVLVCDIGGTKTRFARARPGGPVGDVHQLENDAFPDIFHLFREAIRILHPWNPASCVLAVAAPVDNDHVLLTNRAWSFSQRKLRQEFRIARMLVVNDFVAAANCLPLLKTKDLFNAGGSFADPRRTALVCGPGTGFGSAALLKGKNRVQALASESGHMRLGAATPEEAALLDKISAETGKPVVEHVLSGAGLARVHRILAGQEALPETIVSAAHDGDSKARETIDVFLRFFGRIAGDLALAFDARGGVFIASNLGRSLGPFIPNSPFRAAFEDHAPYQTRLAAIATNVIAHPYPGLLGAAKLARELPPRQ